MDDRRLQLTEEQLLFRIALTHVKGVGSVLARQLLSAMGSPEAIFSEKKELVQRLPKAPRRLLDAIFSPS